MTHPPNGWTHPQSRDLLWGAQLPQSLVAVSAKAKIPCWVLWQHVGGSVPFQENSTFLLHFRFRTQANIKHHSQIIELRKLLTYMCLLIMTDSPVSGKCAFFPLPYFFSALETCCMLVSWHILTKFLILLGLYCGLDTQVFNAGALGSSSQVIQTASQPPALCLTAPTFLSSAPHPSLQPVSTHQGTPRMWSLL